MSANKPLRVKAFSDEDKLALIHILRLSAEHNGRELCAVLYEPDQQLSSFESDGVLPATVDYELAEKVVRHYEKRLSRIYSFMSRFLSDWLRMSDRDITEDPVLDVRHSEWFVALKREAGHADTE